jgi:hypothetical protein
LVFVIVFVGLTRDNAIDLLDALGSVTAVNFKDDLKEVSFSVTRFFPSPRILTGTRTVSSLSATESATLDFSGRYGTQSLETCFQIDPVGVSFPDDPYFNEIAYHVCGSCKTELLESSATAFEPVRSN